MDEHADDALAELVRRHVDLVYSAALRQVGGDAHFAQDVVQVVFTTFLRKAGTLRDRSVLNGWLYTATHHAAAKLVRTERRRKVRDMEVYTMNEIESSSPPEGEWHQFRPVLDDAMHELNDRDRETVLLRYFEKLPLAEVGRRLGVSENAASKAVERSLDRLRERFARRGITSTSAALAVALADQAVAAAPVTLAPTVTASLLAGDLAVIGSATSLALMAKKLSLVVLACLVLVASLVGYARIKRLIALPGQIARLELDKLPKPPPRPAPLPSATPSPRVKSDEVASGKAATTPAPVAKIITEVTNAGRATPEAANETMYWAMEHGEVQVLAEDMAYEPDAKAIIQKIFDVLPAETRAFYGTAEIMMAAVACYGYSGHISRLEFVGSNDDGTGTLTLSYLRNGERRQGEPLVRTIPMVKGDDGWKNLGQASMYLDKPKVEFLVLAAEEFVANQGSTRAAKVKMPPTPPKP